MKFPIVLLACSLATNAALVTGVVLRPNLVAPQFRPYFESATVHERRIAVERKQAEASEAHTRQISASQAAAAQAQLWSRLAAGDVRGLTQRLREAGFPDEVIRSVVRAEVSRQFMGRIRELSASASATPYWEPNSSGPYGFEVAQKRSQLYREQTQAIREALKDLDPEVDDIGGWQQAQYGNLSRAKIEMLKRIADDYSDMASEVRNATRGIMLPEDREKLALLDREKKADLAAILTPQELDDYEMRSSPITNRLRSAMSLMDASEQEFQTIFRIQQKYDADLNPARQGVTIYTSDMTQKRDEAQKQVQADLVNALGATRAAEYERDSNYEFQGLARLAQTGKITMDAAVQAYDLRSSVTADSTKIAADASLTGEQKLAALQKLVQDTKAQLTSTLGADAADAYIKSAYWLTAMERGSAVTLRGSSISLRPVNLPASKHQ